MIITEKILLNYKEERKLEKLKTLYLNNHNINNFDFKNKIISNIEYLSIQNNNLINLDFIKFLPNLWYLDARNNPIENYHVLHLKNVFGFLGISLDKYCEKSLLQVKKLNIGIIYLNLDEQYKKYFLMNNPNIIQYNEEVLLFSDKIYKKDNSLLSRKKTFECKI